MNRTELKEHIDNRWPGQVNCRFHEICEVICASSVLPELCGWLFLDWDFSFAGLVVEETAKTWQLRYIFYDDNESGLVHVLVQAPVSDKTFPSITKFVHAADWHEREAEDMFGLKFEEHPRLGDFILHDDAWQEGVEPMRPHFDPGAAFHYCKPAEEWRPRRIVQDPGAFVMSVGPKYSGISESAHFLLETVGEDVIRSTPRLFYKWRAVEKLAEGKSANDVLLIAERFSATTAFAHGLGFCRAVETVCKTDVPLRAQHLRIFLSELERLRSHVGAIQYICESTALAVAKSQAAILEEDLLRISGELTGHRYLFGLLALGGLLCDLPNEACAKAFEQSKKVLKRLNDLRKLLRVSSSFLDRLEEVGIVEPRDAKVYGLAGPVARASGLMRDLRKAQPYSGYENFTFDTPVEKEGDGYARLRILFAEARQSVMLMEQVLAQMEKGEGNVLGKFSVSAGAALGWVEAPRGGTFHWVRLDKKGKVVRYHITTPSLANWHGSHLAAENFAFQDFPIILSTLNLSVAENDR